MKILLTTLNSKYIHSNLALRYLKAYSRFENVEIAEYTINDNISNIISNIYQRNADIIAFSCYIWNIEATLKIASSLKKAKNNIKIILGGPEVSYFPEEILKNNSYIDFIIFGEGEVTFKELIENINADYKLIDGIAFREKNNIFVNKPRKQIQCLDDIPFPYDDLEKFENKIAYYESSRGCPFNCQYCLSSTIEGVRFLSMNRVKKDLKKFISVGVKQVKFIDRSFNCDKKRTKEIFRYLIELKPRINFHFEINADLIDEEILEILKDAPNGLFQFEVGVQSTNENTIKEISRISNFEKLSRVVNMVNSYKNIHLHLDLIAGLPNEGFSQFKNSFNDVYNLSPQMLQLGFLKLLKGSGLRINAEKYGIIYNDFAPYEVISTSDISFAEILKLKDIEETLEKYYNSSNFNKSLDYIVNNIFDNPFDFYETFSDYWRSNGLFDLSHSSKSLYTILFTFINKYNTNHSEILNELLKYDYLYNNKSFSLPNGLIRHKFDLKPQIFEFLKNDNNINKYLPLYINNPAKEIYKNIHLEVFEYNVLSKKLEKNKIVVLFDYNKDIVEVFNISSDFNIDY